MVYLEWIIKQPGESAMIESFLSFLRVCSVGTAVLSFCLLMYPAVLPFWGQALDIKAAYALIFSLLTLSYTKLGERIMVARYMVVYNRFISQALVLVVVLMLLMVYTAWYALSTLQHPSYTVNAVVLLASAAMALASTVASCIAVYYAIESWYQESIYIRFGHHKTFSQKVLSNYNCSLRSNSSKCCRPQLASSQAHSAPLFESSRKVH